jgi:hypothetical protein
VTSATGRSSSARYEAIRSRIVPSRQMASDVSAGACRASRSATSSVGPASGCFLTEAGLISAARRDHAGPDPPKPDPSRASTCSGVSRIRRSRVTDQAEPASPSSRSRVTHQPEPKCHASGGTKHHLHRGAVEVDVDAGQELQHRASASRGSSPSQRHRARPGRCPYRRRPAR